MRFEIAVVGAGFSGTMVAVHLLRLARSSSADVVVSLSEQSGAPGRGHAYATTSPIHILNVPAGRMSAFADAPDHFLEWARARDGSVSPGAFLPRHLYGEYVAEILDREARASDGRLRVLTEEVLDVEPEGEASRLRLRSGTTRIASHVVLATGHPLPAPPIRLDRTVLDEGRYKENPWHGEALDRLPDEATLLLLGSGLTTVDVLLDARSRGLRGVVHILSRRGLIPQPHDQKPAPRAAPPDIGAGRVRPMMRRLRNAIREAAPRGEDWRPIFDSLRPSIALLWASLDLSEKRRFLRHARPYWEIHRHRIAPDIAARVHEELDSGRAVLHAGRLLAIEPAPNGARATVQPRGRSERIQLTVGRVVNGTGPNTSIEMWRSELTRALLSRGLCVTDELGIGLRCDEDGAVLDARGRVSERLFTLGPLRKGDLWESTAVPEIRVQAEGVARRILAYT